MIQFEHENPTVFFVSGIRGQTNEPVGSREDIHQAQAIQRTLCLC